MLSEPCCSRSDVVCCADPDPSIDRDCARDHVGPPARASAQQTRSNLSDRVCERTLLLTLRRGLLRAVWGRDYDWSLKATASIQRKPAWG